MGGAIFNQGGIVGLANCTLTGNTASGGDSPNAGGGSGLGGGLMNLNGSLTLTNCTIAANTITAGVGHSEETNGRADGSAVYSLSLNVGTVTPTTTATVTLANGILAGSLGSTPVIAALANVQFDGTATVNATGPNIVFPALANGGTLSGTPLTFKDPNLGSLADNGGPTQTMIPQPGSPALDAGDNAVIPSGATTDQRGEGFVRISNGKVELGAFEVQVPVVVAPAALPGGQVGAAYNQTITASGPPGPYTFTITSGALPDGLSLGDGGALAGTPTASGVFDFTVTATNTTAETGSLAFTLTVDPPVVISPDALPAGMVGTTYSQTLSASGPPGPYTFTVTGGSLPDGLTLSDAGVLSGTPIAAGAAVFTVTATNPTGEAGSVADTLTVDPLPPLPPPPPPAVGGPNLVISGSATGAAGQFAVGTLQPLGGSITPFPGFSGDVRAAAGDFDGDGVRDTVLITGPGAKTVMAVVSGKDGSILLSPTDPFGDANFTFGGFVTAGDIDHDGKAEWVVTPELRGGPRVVIFRLDPAAGFTVVANFFGIQDDTFRDGARAALGDVNGDGILDVFAIAAFNGGPRTALFDGRDILVATGQGRAPAKLTGDFFAAASGQDEGRGGRGIAVGDVNGDGVADLIVTGDNLLGTGNQVTIFSGADLIAGRFPGLGATPLANFTVGGQNPAALVSVAAINADGDGRADLAVGSGAGQPSQVKIYLGTNLSGTAEPTSTSLDPFGTVTTSGVFIG
jgi:hypothetical protein